MPPEETLRIRVLAIAIVKRDDDAILVCEGFDRVKQERFYRPLGGQVEFGETGEEALAREFKEEIGAEVENTNFLGTVENTFTFEGKPGHEIVLVYSSRLKDSELYRKATIEGLEDFPEGVMPFKGVWMPIESFRTGQARLYPEKLMRLLDSNGMIERGA